MAWLVVCLGTGWVQSAESPTPALTNSFVVFAQGIVEYARAGASEWRPAQSKQVLLPGDRVRTGERSRAEVYLASGMTIKKGELSELLVPPAPGTTLKKGIFHVFNREKGKPAELRLPEGTAAIRGTDFLVRVVPGVADEVVVLEGEVSLSNAQGETTLGVREKGILEPGAAPRKTAVVEAANNLMQWALYYPAVLDPDELDLSPGEREAWAESLACYRAGNLPAAAMKHPWSRAPDSGAGRCYQAALLLSVGQVEAAETVFKALDAQPSLVAALERLVHAVRVEPWERTAEPASASEWLADSYLQQSRRQLASALRSAQVAAAKSPGFAFAWARVADLEFGFGHNARALAALELSLSQAPANAAALALQAFVYSARNQISAAFAGFEGALEADGAFAPAWLGRGLCLIRKNRMSEGLRDLVIAASLEPQRAVLRSYLGKAFGDAGLPAKAVTELNLAKQLDANDPTAWLYAALLEQLGNQVNDALADLRHSQVLNANRSLFRSDLLLDQDRAVRSANLAAIYSDLGLSEVSVLEAARAVQHDYANYSAHLFLANSYAARRDPNLIGLRYETVTFSEYLLANLLSPVGAGTLSQTVSAQEYSKLFERERLGLSGSASYATHGDWTVSGSQYGTFGGTAYALDGGYRRLTGYGPNTHLEQNLASVQVKQQLGPQDLVYAQAIRTHLTSGDTRPYYDPAWSSPTLRVTERQEPNLFLGWNHQWQPGVHTLLLVGRLQDDFELTEPNGNIQTLLKDANEVVVTTAEEVAKRFRQRNANKFGLEFSSGFEAYTAELQQLLQFAGHTLVVGARYQDGHTDTDSVLRRDPRLFPPVFPATVRQSNTTELRRGSAYAYYYYRPWESLGLQAGVNYDRLYYPENIDLPPISEGQVDQDQVSPHVGLEWQPWQWITLRGAFSRSVGGLFYDTSVRLEPTHTAGFNQAFRSLIPEAIQGPVAGARFETAGVGLDLRPGPRTYAGAILERLASEAGRKVGVFDYVDRAPSQARPASTPQELEYQEDTIQVYLHQLLGRQWAVGARYQLAAGDLDHGYPELQAAGLSGGSTSSRATLHLLSLSGIWNHPSGLFAQAHSVWADQSTDGSVPGPGDDFWQFHLLVGYRFPRRQAEVAIGLLNLTGTDYRLYPLNLYPALPRARTLAISAGFSF